ncbi:YrrS family protein [Texcoconibacillus texcoconensis]|uniref:Cytoskeletal protein RodZ n=1 Tax=Texcoconibacillus texcoconensis TaxID=1095777 RepID=A0A840QPB2_9BACI|nr:YrrS family protein [Texcoconibacillus texcoconensis]MBB5173167.1 cytoskeletal protein RodZ [Texcoconibacillus texcoconensis]
MTEYNSYGLRRSDMRRKKKISNILNIAIIVVVIAILFLGYQLFFGGPSDQASIDDPEEETELIDEEESSDDERGDVSEEESETGGINDDQNGVEEEINGSEEEAVESEDEDETSPDSDHSEGEWEPIGTEQEVDDEFRASYDMDSLNWAEMVEAIVYATGLDEDEMTIWHLGNGGDPQSAKGIVGRSENANTPYEVRLEWVTNEGWMPVSIEKLEENNYR